MFLMHEIIGKLILLFQNKPIFYNYSAVMKLLEIARNN